MMENIIHAFVEAGYYRARIISLSEFDKIIGGMAWAMQVFSYDINIDVFFTDTLDLGQKIGLTERLVMVLICMKCPYRIEPHQIVGLDYANLLPCIRWLLKRSEEIRREHEAFNRLLALRHYQRVTKTNGGAFVGRSRWCHVVPVKALVAQTTAHQKQKKQSDDAPENERTIGADETGNLLADLRDRFVENQSVSFVNLPAHFRAVNVSTTNDLLRSQSREPDLSDQSVSSAEEEEECFVKSEKHLETNLIEMSNDHQSNRTMSEEEKFLHKELDNELLATNQKILIQLKKLDSMPNELEINQYQRRYVELHQQLISKNNHVKKLFDLYNCLNCTKHYLMKEINLLDSIAANLDLTVDSDTNRDSFLKQFTEIISKIQLVREDAQKRRDALRIKCESLNEEYANLVDQD